MVCNEGKGIMKKIRSLSIETALIFTAICTSLIGFAVTIIGALFNGWAMFNGSKDLSKGFGIILIGDSIVFLGVILIVLVIIISIFKWQCEESEKMI